jgi:hypothetical protein
MAIRLMSFFFMVFSFRGYWVMSLGFLPRDSIEPVIRWNRGFVVGLLLK